MDGTLLMAAGAALLASLGYVESWAHRRALRRIPIRIHVNGTRGKSSVTRLIAAGLRAGGIRTCAKTTGTLPRMIMPDGTEFPVFRPARANVIEQLRVVRTAVAQQAEALVIECMALQPALQALCEEQIVRSTHGVITNARADHLEVMGPEVADVARALAGTVPRAGRLYTAEQKHLPILAAASRQRNSQLISIADDEVADVSWDEMAGFAHIEHPDNVALALRVCTDLGVERDTALCGMWQAPTDAGVMNLYQVDDLNRQIFFVNGFAANDPESTGSNWNMLVDRFRRVDRHIALLNCRADRADRSVQLADACLRWKPADHYVLIGSATEVFARRALSRGLDPSRLTRAENVATDRLVGMLNHRAGRSAMVMGMGNISGPGLDVIQYFQRRHRLAADAAEPRDPEDGLADRRVDRPARVLIQFPGSGADRHLVPVGRTEAA
jgi:poly-gamma-glutamate synthase PgsB/CapB